MSGISSQDVEKLVADLKQWKIGLNASGLLLPKAHFDGPTDRNYNLKNFKTRKFLQHEKQTFGINLGWTDDAEPQTAARVARWFFARKGSGNEPIRYGEVIAMGFGGSPSFVKHEVRDVGVNLGWSESPVFEWQLLGGKTGDPIKAGADAVAIFNQKADECLIFFDRTAGGDIGWPSSKTWAD